MNPVIVLLIIYIIVGAFSTRFSSSLFKTRSSLGDIVIGMFGGFMGGLFAFVGFTADVPNITVKAEVVILISMLSAFVSGVFFSAIYNHESILKILDYLWKLSHPSAKQPIELSTSIRSTSQTGNARLRITYSAFISYRRIHSTMLATHIQKELKRRGINAYLDTQQVDGAGQFPDRLLDAIEKSHIFICLLADTTLDSSWVRQEIEHAYRLNKAMIPVFQESFDKANNSENEHHKSLLQYEHIQALLKYDGVHILDQRNLYVGEAIARLAKMIKGKSG